MRRLIFVALIALIGLLPITGSAQTPAASQSPAGTAPAASRFDDTSRVMTIGLGAVTGLVVASVMSTNMITRAAMANLGQGALVFIGTVVGGLAGNWFYSR